MRRDAFKYEVSIATDYAIGYGRDRYCARVPCHAAQMARIVDYLNGLNRPYRDGKAEYEWSVLNDNCIHVAHNALAAIGFWPVWPTHRFILIAAFDFPVPKNEFVNIMRRANDMPIEDLLAVWNDKPARRAVLAGEGLPTRAGALATFEPRGAGQRAVQHRPAADLLRRAGVRPLRGLVPPHPARTALHRPAAPTCAIRRAL